jgi:hypothetical protein
MQLADAEAALARAAADVEKYRAKVAADDAVAKAMAEAGDAGGKGAGTGGDPVRRGLDRALAGARETVNKLMTAVKGLERRRDELTASKGSAAQAVKVCESRIKVLSNVVERRVAEIAKIGQRFPLANTAAEFHSWVKEQQKAGKLHGPIYGPLIAYVDVQDAAYARQVRERERERARGGRCSSLDARRPSAVIAPARCRPIPVRVLTPPLPPSLPLRLASRAHRWRTPSPRGCASARW